MRNYLFDTSNCDCDGRDDLVTFVEARFADSRIAACGAVQLNDGFAELKRIFFFVVPLGAFVA